MWVRQSVEAWRRTLQLKEAWFCHRHLHHYKVIQVFALYHHSEWGIVKRMSINLPKTFTGSTSGACECFPCAIMTRSQRNGSLLSTPQEFVLVGSQVSNPLRLGGFGDRFCVNGRKHEVAIISSSGNHHSTKRLHRYLLTDGKMPEAEATGEGLDVGAAQEANPTGFHNDICSPGQLSQGTKASFLIHSAFIFSFKKWSRDTWIFVLW